MLFRATHNNSITTFFLVPILFFGFWMRFLLKDIVHVTALDNPSMPIWDNIVEPFLATSKYTAALTTYILALITGWSVNRMVSRYNLLSQQSMLPLIVYGMLCAAFLSVQKLNPMWFFVAFFILGIERLFAAENTRNPAVPAFDSALLIGLGSLIYPKGIFFFPILLVSMGILRLATFRSVIASTIGLVFPFIISFTWFFYFDKGIWFLNELQANLITNPGQYNHNLFSQGYMTFIIALLTFSILGTVRQLVIQKVIIRRYLRVFIWIILLTGAAVLTPFFSMEMIPLAATGSSVIIAFWLDKISRKWIQESIFFIIIAITIAGQILLN